jgi:hypothetical protein
VWAAGLASLPELQKPLPDEVQQGLAQVQPLLVVVELHQADGHCIAEEPYHPDRLTERTLGQK